MSEFQKDNLPHSSATKTSPNRINLFILCRSILYKRTYVCPGSERLVIKSKHIFIPISINLWFIIFRCHVYTKRGQDGGVHLLNVMYFVLFLTKLGKWIYKYTINITHENIILWLHISLKSYLNVFFSLASIGPHFEAEVLTVTGL